MRNHSNENGLDLHEIRRVGETHFHMNGFAQRVVLTQRQKVTRKWPIKGTILLWTRSLACTSYHPIYCAIFSTNINCMTYIIMLYCPSSQILRENCLYVPTEMS